MRFFFPLVASVLLLAGDKVNCDLVPPREYVPLIMKIREYYRTSTVFTVHQGDLYNDYGVLPIVHIAHTWTRMLSREGIVTLDLHFLRMHRALRYVGNTVRPLFLVIIGNEMDFHTFSAATRTFNMPFAVWFVLFIHSPEKGAQDHCHHPIGNPFNLNFNVEMLVRCPNDNVLREWYSIDHENVEISELAIWKRELASPFIPLTNLSLFERRRNLRGMVLRGIYVKNSAVFKMVNGKMEGMLGRIILELMEVMNFTLNMRMVTEYGIITNDGNWNGAIGELVADRADIGICEFSMTANRVKIVDYLTPILISRNRLYFKLPDAMAVQWFAFFKVFSLWVWICVIAIILLTTILISVIHAYSDLTRTVELISDSFLSVWGIFCQQGLSESPKFPALRVAYFTTFTLAVVVSAAYSAALICFLTAYVRKLPFLSVDEFIHAGHYRLIVLQNSADYEQIVQSEEKFSRAVKSLINSEDDLPLYVEEGFEQICNNPKLVFYSSQDKGGALTYWIPCSVGSIDAGSIDSMSMILRKGSPYTDIINHNILKFMFNGMINRLKGTKMGIKSDHSIEFSPVRMDSIAPILTIFCCGVVLGLAALFIEKCYFLLKRGSPVETRMS